MSREQRIAETARELREAAEARGLVVTGDGRVSAADAAALVGIANGTLQNLRYAGAGPAFYNRPLGGSRVSYRIEHLAEWLERGFEETI